MTILKNKKTLSLSSFGMQKVPWVFMTIGKSCVKDNKFKIYTPKEYAGHLDLWGYYRIEKKCRMDNR